MKKTKKIAAILLGALVLSMSSIPAIKAAEDVSIFSSCENDSHIARPLTSETLDGIYTHPSTYGICTIKVYRIQTLAECTKCGKILQTYTRFEERHSINHS